MPPECIALSDRFFLISAHDLTQVTRKVSDALVHRRINGRMMLFRLGLLAVDQIFLFCCKSTKPLTAVLTRA
jgi:hypothetical protein